MFKNVNKIFIVLTVVIVVAIIICLGLIYGPGIKEYVISAFLRKSLPAPVGYEEVRKGGSTPNVVEPTNNKNVQNERSLVSEVNLAVPFSPQAPLGDWGQPYQDACEEAAVIMVRHFLDGEDLSADQMNSEVLKMVAWEEKSFGSAKDTNIEETAQMVNTYYADLFARSVYDITMEDIKDELRDGNTVLVLANGQLLGNPYYTQPGPKKHALVIKGFKGNKFITNDPGTKRGADYIYTSETLYNSIVDYDGNTVGTGKKAMIIISFADEY